MYRVVELINILNFSAIICHIDHLKEIQSNASVTKIGLEAFEKKLRGPIGIPGGERLKKETNSTGLQNVSPYFGLKRFKYVQQTEKIRLKPDLNAGLVSVMT